MRVLLVEDDVMIGRVVQQELCDASYMVDWVQDGLAALAMLIARQHALVLLDVGLPKMDGMAVLGALRAAGNDVPVLLLSARNSTHDLVAGLDGGANDYLVKPFAMGELLARMRVLTRRKESIPAPALTNGVLALDPATHEASSATFKARLTLREFALLQALLTRPGAILSRTELEMRIYGGDEEVESNAVEFLIHSLRKKLGSATIRNVRGVGWMVPNVL